MKKIIFLITSLFIASANAYELKLDQFDQEKLADLINRLPATVKSLETNPITDPVPGVSVKSQFPKEDVGFKAICESKFYGGSPYPSSSTCLLSVDENHPNVDHKYDEYKLIMEEKLTAQELFNHISYGKPHKDFRSFGKNKGIIFTGKSSWVFHYRFKCSAEACTIHFSKIIGNGFGESRSDRLF